MRRRPGAASDRKNGFPHFMLKEIYEQPEALRRLLGQSMAQGGRGQLELPGFGLSAAQIRRIRRITIAASGSSRHAGMAGEFMIERMAGLDVEVDFASQYCYRDPIVGPGELAILISQSGTTVDTMAALRLARARGALTLGICNVAGTPLTREADATLLTCAGEEVAIAATKSFITQLAALLLFSGYLAGRRSTINAQTGNAIAELMRLPCYVEAALEKAAQCRRLAAAFQRYEGFIYAGRDIDYPIAMEGALKLKEVSYLHAEGYPTGELKHGPTALLNRQLPIVILATHRSGDAESQLRYRKTVANIREYVARRIPVLAVITAGDRLIPRLTRHVVAVPDVPVLLQPIVEVVPLQLLAYYVAVLRGRDVDRPRNLSKSVVVE
ncbi:MAG: isomerizing glutamine--fructose-6-phosphate transaminase [Acidobacteria bacterium]|nr:isomerizing glutamine--fructose-6-phosphate transaminase [Acidobacteriota bacterium]